MNVFVSQVYIEAGIYFPFSHRWQVWLSDLLSLYAKPSTEFVSKYGGDFKFGFNISSRKHINQVEVRGPWVSKKHRKVEYTLFLPYDVILAAPDGCRAAMEFILHGIREVFAKTHIRAEELGAKEAFIIGHVCGDPTMLEEPWPTC